MRMSTESGAIVEHPIDPDRLASAATSLSKLVDVTEDGDEEFEAAMLQPTLSSIRSALRAFESQVVAAFGESLNA